MPFILSCGPLVANFGTGYLTPPFTLNGHIIYSDLDILTVELDGLYGKWPAVQSQCDFRSLSFS